MINNIILKEYLINNNGLIKAADAKRIGISNKALQYFTNIGHLERIAFGLYMLPEYFSDEYYIAQYRCPKGIFSYETALFFHDLSDRMPLKLTMTIPSGYNTRLLKDDDYKFYYCKKEIYELGIVTLKTSFGNDIKVYNMERTLCDALKKRKELDQNIILNAVKQYIGKSNNDYAKLLNYAEVLKVKNTVKQYLEVLL